MSQGTDRTGPPFDPAALLTVMAFPVVVWTTRLGTWGDRYLGGAAVLGTAFPLAVAALSGPDPAAGWVLIFWLATVGRLLGHRARGLWLRVRGCRCHSRSWGESYFEPADADLAGQKRARLRCSAAALAAGLALVAAECRPLGVLLLLSVAAKLASDTAAFAAVEDRLRQMADARLETEFYVSLFRDRHDR